MKKTAIVIFLLGIIISCDTNNIEQTVESAYVNPHFLPDNLKYKIPVNEIMLKYKFSRNGRSNVDYSESTLLKEPLDIILRRLTKAQIFHEDNYNEVLNYYREGIYQVKPEQEVSSSENHKEYRENVRQDFIDVIDKTAEISGYKKQNPSSIRNREASAEQTGYIGYSVGDPNVAFVNKKGVILAEVFEGMVLGAVYLDKVLNEHLDEHLFDDENLQRDHENVVLPAGRNYTVLEHHWDLAYGYFQFLQSLSQPDGIPALRYSEQKLYDAFVQGRLELGSYKYENVKAQLKIIREEISKVIAVRIINYLTGQNTIINLKEGNGSDAFTFLSRAYGLIYAIQFTRKADGNPYFTYAQVKDILSQLDEGNGFWEKDRLLQDEKNKGSVNNIAKQIAEPFDFSVQEIKR